jgi:lactoylglutathione lyase
MRIAITAIGIVCFLSVYGQSTPNLNLSFNHMALSVRDVNKSADFYKNILGLEEITNRTKMDGIRWFSLGEGKELHLISIVKDTVIINKAIHLALTTKNFDALVKTLSDNNIVYSDWPGTPNKVNIRADGIRQVFFQDPNGYWIEVNSVGQ